MNKNLLTQMIYRIILCCVSGLAVILTFGIFYAGKGPSDLTWEFLKYYTNLSNYFVFAVSVVVLADTVKRVKEKEKEGYNRKIRNFKFITTVMILVTFLVYSILAWIKNTRAWTLLKGIIVILVFWMIAAIFQMSTILWIMGSAMNVAIIAVVIIFQPELRRALPGLELEVLEKRPVEYRCDCSRERMERALISLGREELREMIDEQGGAELTCRFCDNVQKFSKEELEALLASC